MTTTYTKKEPLKGTVKNIKPVEIKMVYHTALEPLWDELVKRYHYLGYRKMLGARLKYLVFAGGSPIAALGFRSASLKIKARDRFVGWSEEQRLEYLPQVVNNNRFLILPWVQVKNLGSYILSRTTRQLPQDWYRFYGRELLLVETFVDPRWFQGTIYKAANWIYVGNTMGFTRQGVSFKYHGHTKEVYLYPLKQNFRKIIGCKQRPLQRPSKYRKRSRNQMLLTHDDWDPNVVAELYLNSEEVYKLADRLLDFHREFRPCFDREEQRILSLVYMKGLASDLEAKSAEPIALRYLDKKDVRSMQHFFTGSTWNEEKVLAKHQILLSKKIADEDGMFTIDSSETPKKGRDSAGVARQYCGNQGKVDNCQSGVFLGYASQKGYGLIDRRLYIPAQWFGEDYAERREKCHFPEGLSFATKPQLALAMLEKAEETGAFSGRWVGFDSTFGSDPVFRDTVGEKYYYFAAVRANTQVWLERSEVGIPPYKGRGPYPKKEKPLTEPLTVSQIAEDPSLPWKTVTMGEGAKGPIIADVARLRVIEVRDGLPGKESWLFLRRNADGTLKYALSNASEDISMEEMIRVAGMRWSIEQLFQKGKSYLGMDHYEVRSYPGWHRHMTLVFLVMHFLLSIRLEFGQKKPYNASSSQTPAPCCSG